LPSDNRNAIALLHVRDQNIALGGNGTAQQAFSALVADAGTASQSAVHQASQAGAVLEQIDNLRASTSGVSSERRDGSADEVSTSVSGITARESKPRDSMLNDLLNLRR